MGASIDYRVRGVSEVTPADLEGLDWLIVGSPTHGGFPTPDIITLLRTLLSLAGTGVAEFGTRARTIVFGYAAPKVAKRVQKRGRTSLCRPKGSWPWVSTAPLRRVS
jgi:hypothetical protein